MAMAPPNWETLRVHCVHCIAFVCLYSMPCEPSPHCLTLANLHRVLRWLRDFGVEDDIQLAIGTYAYRLLLVAQG